MALGITRAWQIRPLRSADAAAVTALVHAAFSDMEVPLDPPPTALGETEGSIADRIAVGDGVCAELAGVLVASILWAIDDGLHVARLAVHPAWRRRGIARDLLACADRAARGLQIWRLHLETRLVLTGNLRLFARCGYRECARDPADADPQITLVRLEKHLPVPR